MNWLGTKLENILVFKPWLKAPYKDYSCVCGFFFFLKKKIIWLLFGCVLLCMEGHVFGDFKGSIFPFISTSLQHSSSERSILICSRAQIHRVLNSLLGENHICSMSYLVRSQTATHKEMGNHQLKNQLCLQSPACFSCPLPRVQRSN